MIEDSILERFHKEVLLEPEAALPSNLSNFWLTRIQLHLRKHLDNPEDSDEGEGEDILSLPLFAILTILIVKNDGQETNVSMTEISEHIEYYRMELAIEEIRRKTNVIIEPATIDSIFTNRKLAISSAFP